MISVTSIKHLALRPSIYLGIGSTIITYPTSLAASAALALGTLVTAKNILDNKKAEALDPKSDSQNIYFEFLTEKFRSPGFFPFFQSFWYLWTTIEALVKSDLIKAISFLGFAIGAAANARISNQDYTKQSRDKLMIEEQLNNLWSKLPVKLRVILKDPGVSFPAANIILILRDLDLEQLGTNSIFTSLFAAGTMLAAIAVIKGITVPLKSGSSPKLTGTAMFIAGLSEIFMGVPTMLFGNIYVGIGTIFFGLSNFLYAKKVDPDIFSKPTLG